MRIYFTLDKVIAIVVLCFSIVILALSIILKYYSGVHLLGSILVGVLLYLSLRNKLSAGENISSFQLGKQIQSLSHITFIISLFLSIYLIWSNLYYRPPLYFTLFLVAAASIVLNVFALDETKRSHTFIVLFKIILLTLAIDSGIYYQFPGNLGIDTWWHVAWIQETVTSHYITQGEFISNDYFLFPIFHLSSAITQILTEVSTRTAIFISTGLLMAISSLYVFLIGERLANAKVGLLAALILPLTDHVIERSTSIIAMSLAFCFFLAILYLVLGRDRKSTSDNFLVILLSVALILTHTVAALVMLLSLITVFLSIKLFKMVNKLSISRKFVSLTLITFFGLFMVSRWMQPQESARPFFDLQLSNLVDSFRHEAQFIMAGPATVKNVAYIVTILDNGGYMVLLALAVIGALFHLHPKHRTVTAISLVSIAASLTVLPYTFELFSLTGLLPGRWLPFSYVVLSILAVSGLLQILNVTSLISGNIKKQCVVMSVILAIIFMMTTNSLANDDSPYVFNGARRASYTQSEFTALDTLSYMGVGRPTTDAYFGLIIPHAVGYDEYTSMLKADSRIFIHRSYYLHHPEWNPYYMASTIQGGSEETRGERVLILDYMKMWGIYEWSLIYVNNNVTAYTSATLPLRNK